MGLSARQRSPISGTDYSSRDHITVEECFWIARLVMKHSFSVSELQTVCCVHVANDPSQVVSVHYVRDSGVVSVAVLDSQLPKHLYARFLCSRARPSARATIGYLVYNQSIGHCANKLETVSYSASQSGQRG